MIGMFGIAISEESTRETTAQTTTVQSQLQSTFVMCPYNTISSAVAERPLDASCH